MMDPKSKIELDRILASGPDAANEDEKAFLRARRSYLTIDQKQLWGVTEDEEAPVPRKKKTTDEA